MNELEPAHIDIEDETETYVRLVAEPLNAGFGTTLGNALRRILLSSLPGAAVTSVRIEEVEHEFSTIPHMKEDTTEFLLNIIPKTFLGAFVSGAFGGGIMPSLRTALRSCCLRSAFVRSCLPSRLDARRMS